MANRAGREALRGAAEKTLDLIAEVMTSAEWEKLLRAPLERAVSRGDRALARKLVGAGAAVGDSLREAVRGGQAEVVKDLLLETGVSVDAKSAADGRTLLHVAAREGNAEVLQLLLLKGAGVNTLDNDQWTPLCIAVRCGNMAAVLALLAHGAGVNLPSGGLRNMPVHLAAMEASMDILRTVIDYGADLEGRDAGGFTALHAAACRGKSEAINVLAEAGADLGSTNRHGETALHLAARCAGLQALAALLEHSSSAGVDAVNTQSNQDRTALHYAARYPETPESAEMVELLLKSGADETIRFEGITAEESVDDWLVVFGRNDDVERVRKLLANAPGDRAWLRRGYLVLCRARPDRLHKGRGITNPHSAVEGRTSDRGKLARTRESSLDETVRDSMVEEGTGGDWAVVLVRVLELREEGIFRNIVGFL